MRNDVYTIYELACQKAERVSRDEKCTVHINAIVGMKDGKPDIITHRLSDWYNCDATVATYVNGTKQ